MKPAFFHSLRWRIQLWYGVLLIVITAALLGGFYRYERTVRLQNIDRDLTAPLISLLPIYVRLPGERLPPSPSGGHDFERDLESRGLYVGAWGPDRSPRKISPHAPAGIPLPDRPPGRPGTISRWNGSNYERLHFTPNGEIVLIGMPGALIERDLRRFACELAAIGLGVVSLGLLGGWGLATRAIRPIEDIAAAAERIAAGDRGQRIAVKDPESELGRLAGVLNATFDRLAHAYGQQVRFTADASHELRTPVTILLAKVQTTLARPRGIDEYREALETCRRAGDRMKSLLGDLLDLVRYDEGAPELRLEWGELDVLTREALEFVRPLADERRVTIGEILEPVRGRFDPAGLHRVVFNLLLNAIKHNPAGTHVEVRLQRQGGSVRLVVADDGPGIPPEVRPHIFERFYRGDKARARATGGSGLGLAIAKAIVEAHGGVIAVAAGEAGRGTAFTILLPDGAG